MHRLTTLLAFVFLCWSALTAAQSLQDVLPQLPQCALNCTIAALPQSSCAASDSACLCADTDLKKSIEKCALQTCTVRQALSSQQLLSQACNIPVRNSGPVVLGIGIGFAIPALVVCAIRLYIRLTSGIHVGLDDVFVFLATALAFPLTAAVVIMTKAGLGKDSWGLNQDDIDVMLHWYFAAELMYITGTGLTKLSILLFYLRIFPNKSLRRNTYIMIAFCGAALVAFFFAVLFQCTPISAAWTFWDKQRGGHCINVKAIIYSQAIVNIVSDVPIMLIPIPTLISLSLPKGKKIGLIIVFGLGLFTTVVSIARFSGLVKFSLTSPNFSHDLAPPGYWSLIEIYVGILCVCLPAIRPFLRAIAPRLCGSTNGSAGTDDIIDTPIRSLPMKPKVSAPKSSKRSPISSQVDSQSESVELVETHKREMYYHGKENA